MAFQGAQRGPCWDVHIKLKQAMESRDGRSGNGEETARGAGRALDERLTDMSCWGSGTSLALGHPRPPHGLPAQHLSRTCTLTRLHPMCRDVSALCHQESRGFCKFRKCWQN